ncbi:unnamed protein product [Amoebophrya sp. A25]|nr:unnamed protein product [Amoebophrya sp. A25]|eukprot:GSA25T00001348001.1
MIPWNPPAGGGHGQACFAYDDPRHGSPANLWLKESLCHDIELFLQQENYRQKGKQLSDDYMVYRKYVHKLLEKPAGDMFSADAHVRLDAARLACEGRYASCPDSNRGIFRRCLNDIVLLGRQELSAAAPGDLAPKGLNAPMISQHGSGGNGHIFGEHGEIGLNEEIGSEPLHNPETDVGVPGDVPGIPLEAQSRRAPVHPAGSTGGMSRPQSRGSSRPGSRPGTARVGAANRMMRVAAAPVTPKSLKSNIEAAAASAGNDAIPHETASVMKIDTGGQARAATATSFSHIQNGTGASNGTGTNINATGTHQSQQVQVQGRPRGQSAKKTFFTGTASNSRGPSSMISGGEKGNTTSSNLQINQIVHQEHPKNVIRRNFMDQGRAGRSSPAQLLEDADGVNAKWIVGGAAKTLCRGKRVLMVVSPPAPNYLPCLGLGPTNSVPLPGWPPQINM